MLSYNKVILTYEFINFGNRRSLGIFDILKDPPEFLRSLNNSLEFLRILLDLKDSLKIKGFILIVVNFVYKISIAVIE